MKKKNKKFVTPKENKVKHASGAVSKTFFTIICFVLVIYTIVLLTLLLWGLLTSLKNQIDFDFEENVYKLPNWGDKAIYKSPKDWFNSYLEVWTKFKVNTKTSFYSGGREIIHETSSGFGQMLINSIIYAGVCSVIQALVPAVVAYLLAKYKFKFSKFLYSFILIVYIIPIVGNYAAVITTLRGLAIFDTWIGIFIQKFNFCGMYFFVFYAFFETLPDSYVEAAELDGANQLQILTRVILPQAKQIIFTVILILFVQLWNDYQTPLLYLPTHPTIAYGVYWVSGANGSSGVAVTSVPSRLAGSMSLALPVLILFIFLKDKLMSNVSMGGLKE